MFLLKQVLRIANARDHQMRYLEIGRQMLLLPSIQFVHRAAADDPGASAYGVLLIIGLCVRQLV